MSRNIFIGLLVIISGALQASPDFDRFFLEKTMRLDYFHTGDFQSETYSFDEVYQEPVWAGKSTQLIDTSNLGKYIFQVFDEASDTLIYSRGFCTIIGEWQTTNQARMIHRSFSESIRFPWPKAAVKVTISNRDSVNQFYEVWSLHLDPAEKNFIRGNVYTHIHTTELMVHGSPQDKVDVVILPDGYTKKEIKKFHKDANRMLKTFFSTEPFKSNKEKFNVRSVDIPSNESGIDNPQKAIFRDNALACSFNAFGSDRYILTWDNKTLRKVCALVPYEHIIILVNSTKYGGGGIFNLYATCVSDNRWSDYIFVHEFGHSFAGLADEYYTSSTAYNDFYPIGVEPWEYNITVNADSAQLKWHNMVDKETQIPTFWNKAEYDSVQSVYRKNRKQMEDKNAPQEQIDDLIAANDQWVHDFLRKQSNWGNVGAFEGGGYVATGIYRPYLDCRMFTRSLTGFDPVCTRALETVIQLYSN